MEREGTNNKLPQLYSVCSRQSGLGVLLAGPRTMTSEESDGLAVFTRSRLVSKCSQWGLGQLNILLPVSVSLSTCCELMEPCSLPPPQPDAGRPCFHHRHRRDNHAGISPALLSPSRSPYPIPYYHPRSKIPPDAQPSSTDDPLTASSSSPSLRHLRHSVPDVVIYKHGPRIPSSPPSSSSSFHTGAIHGARARFVSLPANISSFPRIDTECDRLERACGRAPLTATFLRTRGGGDNDLPPSSPHQPRRGDDGGPPPQLAPKWSHWELVLRIKRVLHKDGKDIRDYVEAGQIDELYHRDVEERARRERERGKMARMRTGQEAPAIEENTRPCFFSRRKWVHLG